MMEEGKFPWVGNINNWVGHMKKFIPVLLGSLFTLGAYAQGSATMDGANQTIINTCRSEGGTFISFKDDKCEYSGCAYVGTNGEVNYNGDNERVNGGCNLSEYRNKARNQYKSEIDKKIADAKAQRDKEIADLEKAKKEADRIGSAGKGRDKYDINGDGVVDSKDDLNGDGVVDDKDLEEAARRLGNATSGSGAGASGAQGGLQGGGKSSGAGGAGSAAGGAGNGNVSVGDGEAIVCEELEGNGVIQPGGLCYKECKKKRNWYTLGITSKEGTERKSCIECLRMYPSLYKLKAEYLPKDRNGKVIGDRSVSLGQGVSVKTGVIICKDSKGNVVSATSTGTCPSGTVLHNGSSAGTVIVSGNSGAGGRVTSGAGIGGGIGGSISVGGGVGSGSANGGVQLPAYCNSSKQSDINKCNDWMAQNRRFLCSSSSNVSACLGGGEAEIYSRYSSADCVNCAASSRKQSTLSGIAEIAGAVMPGIAQLGSAYMGARAYTKSNQAWANAAEAGFEQCRLSQQDYMNYLQANELSALTPAQKAAMNCNGYSLNGFAGLGNGLGGYLGAGYSTGYLGGMLGPYGMYNPYGMGGMVGGTIGGIVGGIGMTGGYTGGYVAGGYVGGMAGMTGLTGGYVGYTGGYAGLTGGYAGMTGGLGLVNGISLAGGIASGYTGGYTGMTGYVAGGYAGMTGMAGMTGLTGGYVGYTGGYAGLTGGYAGMTGGLGLVNGVSLAGGIASGYTGGYTGMTGYVAGGYAQGGYMAGGYAQGGYMAGGYAQGGYMGGYNPQLTNMDQMRQQQGTMYQMQQLQGGSAYYNPYNVGAGMNGQMYFGMGAF